MLNQIKVIALFSAACFIIGGITGWKLRAPVVKTNTVTVTKTETRFLKDPAKVDFNTTLLWAKSPIEIEYKVLNQSADSTGVHVRAFDLNKSTEQDIQIPIAQSGDWRVYFGCGAASVVAIGAGSVYARHKWKDIKKALLL